MNCLESPSTATNWGAIIITGALTYANEAGCFYQKGDALCAQEIETSLECDQMACGTNCPVTDTTTYNAYQTCVSQADNDPTRCRAYAASAACAVDAGTPTSACTGPDFQTTFTKIATVLCGSG
jgi:hypothetical protein